MEDDGFTLVKPSKKSAKNVRKKLGFREPTIHTLSTEEIHETLRKLQNAQKEFEKSQFFKDFFTKIWKRTELPVQFEHIVCLGLGNFAQGSNATHQVASKYQLLFLLSLLKRGSSNVLVYDPVLTESEKAILHKLDLKTSNTNTEGQYNFKQERTLYFLPHCPKQLTNNILWSNWDNLGSVVVIGNSFKNTVLSLSSSQLSNLGYLKEASDLVTELPLENSFDHSDIFNNLSVHWFLPGDLTKKSIAKSPSPPNYPTEDLEFIKNGE